MPKPTFFRLPEAKRQRLMQAAIQEFTRAPFTKASISNIIATAQIPRGSFYQYFEDKQDVFFYMLDNMGQELTASFIACLDANDGDLVSGLRAFFDYALDKTLTGAQGQLFQNVFVHMDFRTATHTAFGDSGTHECRRKKMHALLEEHIRTDNLRFNGDQDLYLFMRTAMGILMQSITSYYNAKRDGRDASVTEAKTAVQTALNWLESGVLK